MMRFRNVVCGWAVAIAMVGCKPATSGTTDGGSTTPAVSQAPTALKAATLVCREIRNLDDISPLAEVSVKIGEQSTIVDSISVCQPFTEDMYAAHEMPKDVVAACGGWWAGAGDYLYLVYQGDDAVVMAGWQDESQEDEGFHYKELRRLSRK